MFIYFPLGLCFPQTSLLEVESYSAALEKDAKLDVSEHDPEAPHVQVQRLAALLWGPSVTDPDSPAASAAAKVVEQPPAAADEFNEGSIDEINEFQEVDTEQLDTISDLPGNEPEFPIGEGDDFFDSHNKCEDIVPNSVKDSPDVSDVSDVRRKQSLKRVKNTNCLPRARRGTIGCFGGRYPPDPDAQPQRYAEFIALRDAFLVAKKDLKLSNDSARPSHYAAWIGKRIKALKQEQRSSLVSQTDLFRQAVDDWRTGVLGLASHSRQEAAAAAVAARKEERAQHLEKKRAVREAEAAEEKRKKEVARKKAEVEKENAKTEDDAKGVDTRPKRRRKTQNDAIVDSVPVPVDPEA